MPLYIHEGFVAPHSSAEQLQRLRECKRLLGLSYAATAAGIATRTLISLK